jgi:hypothetical protein
MKNKTSPFHRILLILSAAALTACLLITPLPSPVNAAVPFTEHSDRLTLLDGAGNEMFVTDCWVLKNSDDDYSMWYSHSKTDYSLNAISQELKNILTDEIVSSVIALDLDSLLDSLAESDVAALYGLLEDSASVIGYATSNDGIDWTGVNPEVITAGNGGAWNHAVSPCVVKENGSFHMWYARTTQNLSQSNLSTILNNLGGSDGERKTALLNLLSAGETVIAHATSADGVNWTVVNLEEISSDSSGSWAAVADPSVVANASDDYEIWYTQWQTDITSGELDAILGAIGAFAVDESWLRR